MTRIKTDGVFLLTGGTGSVPSQISFFQRWPQINASLVWDDTEVSPSILTFLRAIRGLVEDHILRRGIQNRTAANRLAERFAEVAQAGITHFNRSFGHVESPAAQ
jgi:hypothetical protein